MSNRSSLNDASYRKGAIMGLTLAETFLLICFALLMLFTYWQYVQDLENTPEVVDFKELTPEVQTAALELVQDVEQLVLYRNWQTAVDLASSPEQVQAQVAEFLLLEPDERIAFLSLDPQVRTDILQAALAAGAQAGAGTWRLVRDTEVDRLVDNAERLAPPAQTQLADLAGAPGAEDKLAEIGQLEWRELDRILEIEPERRDSVVEAALELQRAGVIDPDGTWRFISEADLDRLLDGARRLPEDLQHSLADMVEADKAAEVLDQMAKLEALIEAAAQLPEPVQHRLTQIAASDNADSMIEELEMLRSTGQSLQGIRDRINAIDENQARLAEALNREIGPLVAELGGSISDTGVITLPEGVVFEQGQSRIRPELDAFLKVACQPWMNALRSQGGVSINASIEGHASSEWRRGSSVQDAFLENLRLSQDRSRAVMASCMAYIDTATQTWARSSLVAAGYSSGRPILDAAGAEDKENSRRVVFRATPDQQKILDEIETETGRALERLSGVTSGSSEENR